MFNSNVEQSEENANQIENSVKLLKKGLTCGSVQYRQRISAVYQLAAESTKNMIKSITQIDLINIDECVTENELGYIITQLNSKLREIEFLSVKK